ncbi:MAG: glycosyltransferase family 4 protein [Alphaproteobacteria bacterium]|nr:glycosyltransferase family 4 protein [Alphaproteobacteria bacterium]MDE2111510.1 glycosyltransferase family 4 protein [Alphaproteobacteria bacterium]MDE2493945.1 glycosyltransferase family 4 protein [Alphaproteobacteria bacterium]
MSSRVLVIEPAGQLWGSERALIDLIESVSDIEIAVCCPPGTPLLALLQKRNVKTFPYLIAELHRKSRWRRLQAAFGVMRACRAFKPGVLHVNQAGAYRMTSLAARLLGLSIVCHVRIFDDAPHLAQRTPSPQRLVAIIAISGAVQEEIRRFRNLDHIPVHLIYDAYAPVNGTEMSAIAAPRLAGIACVGRIVPIKGVDILIKALATGTVPADGPQCYIAGSGPESYVSELRTLSAASPSVQITWLGVVDDVFSLLRSCRVLVCPSHREPLGRVVLEAWDAGCVPVVYRGSGGAAEIVTASGGGIVYDDQTAESLADAIARALRLSDGQSLQLVENGRHWMTDYCNQEQFGRTIGCVFESAVRRKSYAVSKAR